MVNRGGISFVFRAAEETGATPVEVARAYTVVREVFRLPDFWRRVEALDNVIPTRAQSALYLECRRLLDRATRWMLQSRRSLIDVESEIEIFEPVSRLAAQIPEMLIGVERERLYRRAAEFEALGAPADLAVETAAMLDVFSLLDIVSIARSTGEGPRAVSEVYFAMSERFQVDRMLTRITQLPREDRWSSLARMALRYDLYGALAGLTRSVLQTSRDVEESGERIAMWAEANAEGLARTRATLDDIYAVESFDLATLSVALLVIRTLVPSGSEG
jgi:glutamate dehydrogenase